MTIDLHQALAAREGIVCAVGAGGKKTTMLRLARGHDGRVALTATTKIPIDFAAGDPEILHCGASTVAADVLARGAGRRIVAFAGEPGRSERLRGAEPVLVRAVHEAGGFAATYVKADGARMRLAKAHDAGEPRLMPGTTTVLQLASVRVVGKVLDGRTVHRPALFAAQAGLRMGARVTADGLATVLAQQAAIMVAASGARVVTVLNMVDDDALLATARKVACALRARGATHRIALTAMLAAAPVRELLD